jgi:hypothetical protein
MGFMVIWGFESPRAHHTNLIGVLVLRRFFEDTKI